ncbi:MAG: quinone-dependent dihydroorotate dehydrogenase [Rickettsiaceae bacterium H1]|nr:quinone-dependent dihydroorotate dehydrogenase [Rickettsiaceae bacterium H1]
MNIISFASRFLLKINPELAHKLAIFSLKCNLVKNKLTNYGDVLQTNALGLSFDHPIGLAAGFDKNAECVRQLLSCGFSFVEVGTVTVKPQLGNLKPRIFRLMEDEAIINRLGFNNEGVENLKKWFAKSYNGVVGINIGKNKDQADPILDYVQLIENVRKFANYITINISSPNTTGLRDLQQQNRLRDLLSAINEKSSKKNVPILLKISPDITEKDKENIAELALEFNVDGLVLTNTTVERSSSLKSAYKSEKGGLSGKPLFSLSTQVLKDMYKLTSGKITLIGCGGISNGRDGYCKIKAGASLIQVYTGLIYQGFALIDKINLELIDLLKKDGFKNLTEAIGIDLR